MRLQEWLGVLWFAVCGTMAASEPAAPAPAREMSLTQCIQMALTNNLDVRIERYTPELARYSLNSSYGIYDPLFEFKAKDDFFNSPQRMDPKKNGVDLPYDLDTRSFAPSLSGVLPTGLKYSLGVETDLLTANTVVPPSFLFPDGLRHVNEYVTSAGLTLRQPLLKDFWIDSARLSILVNKKNLKVAELALRQQLLNTVTKVQLAYYELIFTREQVKVQEKALELARQLVENNKKQVAAGVLRPLDLNQAEARAAAVETDLNLAKQAFAAQQNTLKSLLSDNFKPWADVPLEPTDTLTAAVLEPSRLESWGTAMRLRPDLLQFRVEMEKMDLAVRYRFNQLFPSFDLTGSYGAVGVQDGLGASWDDVKNVNNPAYSYGAVLSVPLSRVAERNHYKNSQAARKQAELQLKKLEQEILVQVDNALTALRNAGQRVKSTHQGRLYAEAALDAENRKFEAGMSTIFLVEEMQRLLTSARSAEIRALADYNTSVVQLAFSEGSTLEKNHLNVQVK